MKKLFVVMLLVLIALSAVPVYAQTITMSNPGDSNSRDIAVYFPNGTMWGFYNDTSVITLDQNESYIFTLKPMTTNPLTDPTAWLSNVAFPFVQSNVVGMMVLVFLAALWWRGGR